MIKEALSRGKTQVKQGVGNKKEASGFTGDKVSFSVGFLEACFDDFTNVILHLQRLKKVA